MHSPPMHCACLCVLQATSVSAPAASTSGSSLSQWTASAAPGLQEQDASPSISHSAPSALSVAGLQTASAAALVAVTGTQLLARGRGSSGSDGLRSSGSDAGCSSSSSSGKSSSFQSSSVERSSGSSSGSGANSLSVDGSVQSLSGKHRGSGEIGGAGRAPRPRQLSASSRTREAFAALLRGRPTTQLSTQRRSTGTFTSALQRPQAASPRHRDTPGGEGALFPPAALLPAALLGSTQALLVVTMSSAALAWQVRRPTVHRNHDGCYAMPWSRVLHDLPAIRLLTVGTSLGFSSSPQAVSALAKFAHWGNAQSVGKHQTPTRAWMDGPLPLADTKASCCLQH